MQICVDNLLELGHHQSFTYVEFLEKPIWSWHPFDLFFMLLPQQLILKWKLLSKLDLWMAPPHHKVAKVDTWGRSGKHLSAYLLKGFSALFSICSLSFERISISTSIFLYQKVLCSRSQQWCLSVWPAVQSKQLLKNLISALSFHITHKLNFFFFFFAVNTIVKRCNNSYVPFQK